eukprot:TRINITY_DN10181_c0_g1_i2.p1 TRINITY_DN10181_c0_g1~~TRINITY_DN10181_c0_g1_i2.p1  ORF type:complete len:256 (+),score=93.78 TRINITY_DN10181_c0_g1_i2:78-770(+)
MDICHLAMRRKELITNQLIKRYHSLWALAAFAQAVADKQLQAQIAMVEKMGAEHLLVMLRRVQARAVPPERANVVLSTVHKAKGLEFDTVVLAEDFVPITALVMSGEPLDQGEREEVQVIYVAITRAKRRLVPNQDIFRFLQVTGAWESPCITGAVPMATHADDSGSEQQQQQQRCAACYSAAQNASGLRFAGSGWEREICEACARGMGGRSGGLIAALLPPQSPAALNS